MKVYKLILLGLSALGFVSVSQAQDFGITVGSDTAAPGETAQVPLSWTANADRQGF